MPADETRLRALAAEATRLRTAIRYGRPTQQAGSVSYEERRAQSPTRDLWPVFREPCR